MNTLEVDQFKKKNSEGKIESEREFLKRLEKSRNYNMYKIDLDYKAMDKNEEIQGYKRNQDDYHDQQEVLRLFQEQQKNLKS